MKSKYRLVVFDWDGTLIDSAGAIVECIQAASSDLGLPVPNHLVARQVIGLGLEDALRHAVPQLPVDRFHEMAERFRCHFLARDQDLNLFSGVPELLGELSARGLKLAVATGKSSSGLARALKISGLDPYFDATRCADQCHPKPHPQMLLELMAELDLLPSDLLMIGDTSHDLTMAANAKVDAVGVSYGAHTKEMLMACSPKCVLDSVEDLSEWLKTCT